MIHAACVDEPAAMIFGHIDEPATMVHYKRLAGAAQEAQQARICDFVDDDDDTNNRGWSSPRLALPSA
eukprot:scaffold206249_cov15-Tisochrysis_lutea.AAC.1